MSVETCPCDTCVYKTVAAKLVFLAVKHETGGRPDAQCEELAAIRLGDLVTIERGKRGGIVRDR